MTFRHTFPAKDLHYCCRCCALLQDGRISAVRLLACGFFGAGLLCYQPLYAVVLNEPLGVGQGYTPAEEIQGLAGLGTCVRYTLNCRLSTVSKLGDV